MAKFRGGGALLLTTFALAACGDGSLIGGLGPPVSNQHALAQSADDESGTVDEQTAPGDDKAHRSPLQNDPEPEAVVHGRPDTESRIEDESPSEEYVDSSYQTLLAGLNSENAQARLSIIVNLSRFAPNNGANEYRTLLGVFDSDGDGTVEIEDGDIKLADIGGIRHPRDSLSISLLGDIHGYVSTPDAGPPNLGRWKATRYTLNRPFPHATNMYDEIVVYELGRLFVDQHHDLLTQPGNLVPEKNFGELVIGTAYESEGTFAAKNGSTRLHSNFSSVAGTLDGAIGIFVCRSENSCRSRWTGINYGLSGGWTFSPHPKAEVLNRGLFHFGYWAVENAEKVQVSGLFSREHVISILRPSIKVMTGTATYVGFAAGKVAYSPTISGTFLADARLTADFGTATEYGNVDGTVDNFVVGGSTQNWSVELQQIAIQESDNQVRFGTATNPGATVWSVGGTASEEKGTYFGEFAVADDTDIESPMRDVAGGAFTAKFNEDNRMSGGFGVELQ